MLGEHQARTLQGLVGLTAPLDKVASGKLSIILRALDGYRSVQGAGSQQAKKVVIRLAGAPSTHAVRLRSEAELGRLVSGNGLLVKEGSDEQSGPAIVNFDELEDGGEYVLVSPLQSTSKRLGNLEQYRGNMSRALENAFAQALVAEYSAGGRAELLPDKRFLKDKEQVVAEVDAVVRVSADNPAHDTYVLGSAKSSITGTSDVDALVGVANEFAEDEGFKGHKILLAFFADYVPDDVRAPLVAKCQRRGVHLFQRSGSDISRVV